MRIPLPLQSSQEEGHGKPCCTRPLGVERGVCDEPLLWFVGKGMGEAGQGSHSFRVGNSFSGLCTVEGSAISDSWSQRYHSGLQEGEKRQARDCGLWMG